MKPKLISFAICPFVQRAAILLEEKGVDYETTFIDLSDKPDWFLGISPRGKVPVLVVDDTPIFESQAICEYLDETGPEPHFMPSTPLGRARDRAWFALASEDLLAPLHRFMITPSKPDADETRVAIEGKLDRLAEEMDGKAFLSGDGARFGMADVAIAPVLFRFDHLKKSFGIDLIGARTSLEEWSRQVLSRPSVRDSVPGDFSDRVAEMMKKRESWLAR